MESMLKMVKTESINIVPLLKRFLEKKKIDFKDETGDFHGMTAVLMKYLEGNTDFLMDFQAYCTEKREKEVLEIPEFKDIVGQDNGELLCLLTKGVVTPK